MTQPFIAYALPRSRTAWMASFLATENFRVGHEIAIAMRSLDDVRRWFGQERAGAVETAAAPGWRLLHHHVPGLRVAVVRRPVADVVASMMATDIAPYRYDPVLLEKRMAYGDRLLAEIAARPGTLALDYADLDTETGCARLFEHCLSEPFARDWWLRWRDRNVQVDVAAVIAYYHANRGAIDGFKRECWRELRRLSRAGIVTKNRAKERADAVA